MSAQTAAIELQIRAHVAKAAKDLILRIDRNLRKTTPVDTGHARASWVPSVGAPSTAEPVGADQSAHDAGVAEVLAYTLDRGALYEATNVAYMEFLNLGSSTQAPVGFIEVAIAEAEVYVNTKYGVAIDVTSEIAAAGADNLADAYSPLAED